MNIVEVLKWGVLGVFLSTQTFAGEFQNKIIYGIDNRIETYQASEKYKKLAASTAGMISSVKLIDIGNHMMLPPTTIQAEMGLCPDERFSDQPSAVVCSGFLVGEDLLVTAGHCIQNQDRCEVVSWVFDYKVNKKNKKTDILISKDNVYKCQKVLESKLVGSGKNSRDFALVKLDRKVKGREALKFRRSGKISDDARLTVIGHPSGLPQKITLDGKIFDNESKYYFETNLDTFGGNSGSAVFNHKSGLVEGVLVRGAKDYVNAECGLRVNNAEEDIAGKPQFGESVSRITDVTSLQNGKSILEMILNNDLPSFLQLVKETPVNEFFDAEGNNALHLAIKNGRIQMAKELIKSGMNLDQQNSNLETALHLAAFKNQKSIIANLIANGADPLIKDKFGALPSGRTNYFAFGVRKALKSFQWKEKQKRLQEK